MAALLFTLLLASPVESPGGQAFRLAPGEYRWIPFPVNVAPADVEAHFEVLHGNPTVHAELLSMEEFRQFNRGKAHGALTATPDAQTGQFRKLISARGQYAIVVSNQKTGAPATVSLELHVQVNPATELPTQKRLIIILLSFLFFLITMGWSGRQLIRAMRTA